MHTAARPTAVPGCGRPCASAARWSGDGGWRGCCAGPVCAACIASVVGYARRSPTRAPNRLWLADSSSIPTREGWRYLAIILDGFSRRVVGWAMADHRQTELVLAALRLALHRRRPAAGLIHHRDRGCQYTSLAFGQHLRAVGLSPSTGSVGDCYDNAVAASFFASLKVELVDRHDWPSRAAARVAIFEYIEVWYKRQRLHSTRGYLSPAQFETRAQAGIAA